MATNERKNQKKEEENGNKMYGTELKRYSEMEWNGRKAQP